MNKEFIVQDKELFNHIIQKCRYIKNEHFVIYKNKNDLSIPRFGIAVGTKLGNAVHRNKIKRQMRHILRESRNMFSNGYDYIIIIKGSVNQITFQDMSESLKKLINEIRSKNDK